MTAVFCLRPVLKQGDQLPGVSLELYLFGGQKFVFFIPELTNSCNFQHVIVILSLYFLIFRIKWNLKSQDSKGDSTNDQWSLQNSYSICHSSYFTLHSSDFTLQSSYPSLHSSHFILHSTFFTIHTP